MTPEEWEETYARYKDEVFHLSLNVQVRRGDPVRERDWGRLEAGRAEMGLTDRQIATRLGLEEQVVRSVRLRAEKENAHPEMRKLLYEIGNKPIRERPGQAVDAEEG